MNQSLLPNYQWPHVVTDVYITIKNYRLRGHMGTKSKEENDLELFQPVRHSQFVSIDIHEPLRRTKTEDQIMAIISDKYIRLKGAISTVKIVSK